MLDGQCPKCESNTVYRSDNAFQQPLLQIPLGGMFDGTMAFNMTVYVCTQCGYTEQYILRRDVLAKIEELGAKAKNWTKVG